MNNPLAEAADILVRACTEPCNYCERPIVWAATGTSLMPEGLEKKIQIQEMADLLTYLLGSK